jgi:hypothetical protein
VIQGATPVLDVITLAQLNSTTPTFSTDRLRNPNGSIATRDVDTFWTLPAGVYFAGDFSIMVWLRVYSCQENERFIDCGNGPGSDNVFIKMSGGQVQCMPYIDIFDGTKSFTGAGPPTYRLPTNDSWVHLALSVTGTTGKLYANGALILSNVTLNSPVNVTRSSCFFGKSNWDHDPYADSDFDEIKFFERGLSHSEIRSDFELVDSFMIQL